MTYRSGKGSRREMGFTLIEVLIVVAIIGILAAIAIPRFQNHAIKAKQIEAKELMSAIYTGQFDYHSDHNIFGASEADLGIQLNGRREYSPVVFTNISKSTFTATTTANLDNDASVDTWVMTQANIRPTHACDDVTNRTEDGTAC